MAPKSIYIDITPNEIIHSYESKKYKDYKVNIKNIT